MATQLFLRDAVPVGVTAGTDDKHGLLLVRGPGLVSYVKNTVTGPVTPPTTTTQWTKTASGAVATFYSRKLNAVTISGTVTFNVWALESAAQANATITAELLRCDSTGAVLSTIAAVVLNRAEVGTTAAVNNWTATPTSTGLGDGDRLGLRLHMDDGNAVTMASGRTITAVLDGATGGVSGDSYVQVTEALVEQPLPSIDPDAKYALRRRPPTGRLPSRLIKAVAAAAAGNMPARPIRRSTPQRKPTAAQGHRSRLVVPPTAGAVVQPPAVRLTQGVRRRNLSRPSSRPVPIPLYNSGGQLPSRVQGVRRRNLSRPASHLAPPAPLYNSGGLQPTLIRGRLWPSVRRPGSKAQPAPAFNSGGLLPQLTQGVRRNNLTRPRSRSLPAPLYNSGGFLPRLTAAQRRLIAPRSRSRLVISLPPVVAAQGAKPIVSRGIRRGPPTRVPTQFLTPASLGAQSAFSASFVSAEQKPLWPRPTRARSRFVQPPAPLVVQGARPSVLQAIRRKPPTRAASDWTAGAVPAAVTLGGAQWVQPPVFNSGGLRAQRSQGVRRLNLTRPGTRQELASRFNSGGLQPLRAQGVRRLNLTRAASRPAPLAPSYNSGGITPSLTRGLRWPAVSRPRSRSQLAPLFNSGGLPPRVNSGIRRNNLSRPASRQQLAARFNSGGQLGLVLRATQKSRPTRANSRFIVATPTVLVGGILGLVFQESLARRRTRQVQLRAHSRTQPPAAQYNSGGQPPRVMAAVQKPRVRPLSPRWLTPLTFIAPGIAPELMQGIVRRPPRPLRSGSRLLGGISSPFIPGAAPKVTRRSTSQPKPGRASSRWLPAQRYNSGGVTPGTVRGVCRKPGPVKPSRLVRSAPYNSGGLKPLFRAAPRQKPPTRGYRSLPHSGFIERGLSPLPPPTTLRFYVQDQEPAAALSSNRQQGALIDTEPVKGLTSGEPSPSLTDTESPNVSTRVKGQ